MSLISNSALVHTGDASGNGDGALGVWSSWIFQLISPLSMDVIVGWALETVYFT